MKRTSASPADNLSPLGGAVLVSDAAETAPDDRNLLVLRDPDVSIITRIPPPLLSVEIPPLWVSGVLTGTGYEHQNSSSLRLN